MFRTPLIRRCANTSELNLTESELCSVPSSQQREVATGKSSKTRNTYPLVKLHSPKAIETKTTAEEHVEAPDSSRINKLDTPMAKD